MSELKWRIQICIGSWFDFKFPRLRTTRSRCLRFIEVVIRETPIKQGAMAKQYT